jgi:nicotinic acid mononucleotide adenylyltransferase
MPKWKNAETDILPFYGIIEIASGEDDVLNEDSYRFVEDSKGNKYPYQRIIQGSTMTASSTEVRNLIRDGLVTYPLVNSEVKAIINEHKLYMNPSE